MGCASSKDENPSFTVTMDKKANERLSTAETSGLEENAESFASFNMIEEADEKALGTSDSMFAKLAHGMGVELSDQTYREQEPTIQDRIDESRALLQTMPPLADQANTPAVVNKAWRGLDAPNLLPSAGGDLLEALLTPDCHTVPKRIVFRIVLDVIEKLKGSDSVAQMPAPSRAGERQIIVGDTHGQLQDVLHILLTHGKPSTTNRYIFNGDIADRGPNAVEIFLLVLIFELCAPGSTVVTRGNHEARDINERPAATGGGFRDEVRTKYDDETYELFQLLFVHLPVAAVVGQQILVIHGGLSRERSKPLAALRALDHKRDVPQRPSGVDETLLFDALWSDPMEEDGIQSGGRGDDTIKWGPDVTNEFLRNSGLELIVRSHQVPPGRRGFGLHHGSKVITVFSASNYAGVCMNRGGVLIVPASGAVAIEEHMAASLEELRTAHQEEAAEKLKLAKPAGIRKSMSSRIIAKEGDKLKGWMTRAHAAAEEAKKASAQAELLKRVAMDQAEAAVTNERMIDSLITSVRARVCQHRGKLRAALGQQHDQLVQLGQAAAGGGLLPLDSWRRALDDVLELQGRHFEWAKMPERMQASLATVVPLPPTPETEASPPLDASLYPAVRWEHFLERFHVEMRDPNRPVTDRSAGVSSALLGLVHAQALPLSKALALAAHLAAGGRRSTVDGPQAPSLQRQGSMSRSIASAGVAVVDFVAAIEALVGAVADDSADGRAIPHAEIEKLVEAAPKDDNGRVLYQALLDSLVVIDKEMRTRQNI